MHENEPSDNSVSVRFARQSSEMCKCRLEVLKGEMEMIAAKKEEIKQAQETCEDLSEKIKLAVCEYEDSDNYSGTVHSKNCTKCAFEAQRKREEHTVSRCERFLPSSQLI
jgi:hypothetical protein